MPTIHASADDRQLSDTPLPPKRVSLALQGDGRSADVTPPRRIALGLRQSRRVWAAVAPRGEVSGPESRSSLLTLPISVAARRPTTDLHSRASSGTGDRCLKACRLAVDETQAIRGTGQQAGGHASRCAHGPKSDHGLPTFQPSISRLADAGGELILTRTEAGRVNEYRGTISHIRVEILTIERVDHG